MPVYSIYYSWEQSTGKVDDMDAPIHPGPQTSEVLPLQPQHRSEHIWGGELLTQTFQGRRVDLLWEFLTPPRVLHPRVVHHLEEMRLYRIISIGRIQLDYALITALIERWQPEYHESIAWVLRRRLAREYHGHHNLPFYRDVLDFLEDAQFIWTPYNEELIGTLPAYCTHDYHIWRSSVPLTCLDIVEHYASERVFRQFGFPQPIPTRPA